VEVKGIHLRISVDNDDDDSGNISKVILKDVKSITNSHSL